MNKSKLLSSLICSSLIFTFANISAVSAKTISTKAPNTKTVNTKAPIPKVVNTKTDTKTVQAYLASGSATDSHQQFTGQVLKILTNDKGITVTSPLTSNQSLLLQYCDKPDSDEAGYAFAYHFYNPYINENYLPSFMSASKITALTKFQQHIKNATINYNSNRTYSIQELGRAMHFLEDVNVPHHAANLIAVLTNHSKYEDYVNANDSSFFITTSKVYDKYKDYEFYTYCTAIFNDCAKNAYAFKDLAQSDYTSNWTIAANATLKYGQENMAALLYRFLQYVQK